MRYNTIFNPITLNIPGYLVKNNTTRLFVGCPLIMERMRCQHRCNRNSGSILKRICVKMRLYVCVKKWKHFLKIGLIEQPKYIYFFFVLNADPDPTTTTKKRYKHMLKVQYTGTGHVDYQTGCVELVCLTPVGQRVGVVVWNVCPEFFLMDLPAGWNAAHVRHYQQFLVRFHKVRLARDLQVEKRRQLMGYVVDLQNGGLPQKRPLIRFTFGSPADGAHALKQMYKHKYFSTRSKPICCRTKMDLPIQAHQKPELRPYTHAKKEAIPHALKFQSVNNCLPMEWFECPTSTVDPSGYTPTSGTCTRCGMCAFRICANSTRCAGQQTATQTVVSWDIETHSDFDADEDSFPASPCAATSLTSE